MESCGVPIIGHRGCAAEAPENTLASLNLAWAQNADAVEIDVFLTRDGRIVAHHDATTKKTAGVDRAIVDQTLAELRQLEVGRWKHERYTGERIPTLEETFATVPAGKRILVEVKCGAEIAQEFQRVLTRSTIDQSQVVIISFDRQVILDSKQAMPDVEAAWVVEIHRDEATGGWKPTLESIRDEAQQLQADGVDLGYAPALTPAEVAQFHDAGLKVYIWTVNTIESARILRTAKVDGLTTDCPGKLREQLMQPI